LKVDNQMKKLKNNIVYVIIILWFGLVYCFALESSDSIKLNLLSVPQTTDPIWYKFYYDITKWPDESKLPVLVDIDYLGYSPEKFLNVVLNKGIIQETWRENALRVSKWTTGNNGPLDTYLYRQKINGGFIHICDTRIILGIAFVSTNDVNYFDDPNKNISEIAHKLINPQYLEDPNWVGFNENIVNGINQGKSWVKDPMNPKNKTFGYCLGKKVAIFAFRKDLGAIHQFESPPLPLFKNASEKLSIAEEVLSKLKSFDNPKVQDIPELLKLMSILPKSPDVKEEQKVYFEDTTRWVSIASIDRAKLEIIRKLTEAVDSIKGGGDKEVELVKKTLGVEKYLQNPNENPERGNLQRLKRASIDALYRIKTDEAAIAHLEIIEGAKEQDRQALLGAIGQYPLFLKRIEAIFVEEKAAGRPFNNYIVYQIFIEDLKQNPIPGVTFSHSTENKPLIKSDLLVKPENEAPILYKYFYPYFRWPDESKLPTLVDIDYLGYSPEEFLNKVIKRDIIDEGWRINALRIRKWINEDNVLYDAYLYRQKIEGGFIHICDTRKTLAIAFVSEKEINFIEDPNKNISDIANKLFRLELLKDPNWLGFVNERVSNILLGKISIYPFGELSKIGFFYCLGENTAFFIIQKSPGVIHGVEGPPVPLFRDANEKLPIAEEILNKLKNYEEPKVQNIPEFVNMYKKLPAYPINNPRASLDEPAKWLAINNARVQILNKIVDALENSREGGHEEIDLIKQALGAEKYFKNPKENPEKEFSTKIKSSASSALSRINNNEGAIINLEMIYNEKDVQRQKLLINSLVRYDLFKGRLNRIFKEEEEKIKKTGGTWPDMYIVYQKFIEDSKKNPIPGVTFSFQKPKYNWLIWAFLGGLAFLIVIIIAVRRNRKPKQSGSI
jgi:hypothetical protein